MKRKNNLRPQDRRRYPVLPVLCTILFLVHPSIAQDRSFDAFINGSRQSLPTVQFDNANAAGFIGIEKLAEVLEVQTYYSNTSRKAIVYFGDTEVKITALNPFVAIGERIVQMPAEARYEDGEIYVPLPYFIEAVAPYYSGSLFVASRGARNGRLERSMRERAAREPERESEPAPAARVLPEDKPAEPRPDAAANIQLIRIEEKANGTLIRIRTTTAFKESHINSRITRGWLYVDIYGGKVHPDLKKNTQPAGLVSKVVPVQLSQMAQISFKLNQEISSRNIYSDPDAGEVLVSLATEEQLSGDILNSLDREKKKWLLDTIVIDAGHGGRDPGAIGPGKVYEKTVTLAIAKLLKKELESRSDVRVVMTRDTDRSVALKDRTRLANQEQGKLFISIHANANRSNRIKGLTTYFLGPAKTEEALEASRRENSVINYEKDTESYAQYEGEGFILLSLAQNAYQSESEELAALVQKHVSGKAKIRDRGVKQAGYIVLIGASMPNVLVEVGFISNRQEEKRLASKRFQKKVAEGICTSILEFKKKYESEF